MKALQIMVFVYIGAASGNWDPGKIRLLPQWQGAGEMDGNIGLRSKGDEKAWVEHGKLSRLYTASPASSTGPDSSTCAPYW